ncbi:hypothetical protein EDB92DRAFT_2117016 [Lactarius akahatsu]|uniref:Uncharacterized protein n=1 Tax=Lactarius akahatsu TaxID=416441 RepID=A0AAD4LDT5_9AGAM|nr:hypothetical protein EDB92DRAFT_2117016 [Lactarius akahatsu]
MRSSEPSTTTRLTIGTSLSFRLSQAIRSYEREPSVGHPRCESEWHAPQFRSPFVSLLPSPARQISPGGETPRGALPQHHSNDDRHWLVRRAARLFNISFSFIAMISLAIVCFKFGEEAKAGSLKVEVADHVDLSSLTSTIPRCHVRCPPA